MKPAEFEYASPSSVEEVVELLSRGAEDAKVLAGGQSLMPLMNLRLASPALVVDINRVRDLAYMVERDGGVAVGAIVRQSDAQTAATLARHCPLVVDALRLIGHPQIRNRGTVVGSLVHHDPAAELPAVAVALGARFTLASAGGAVRHVDAADFFETYFTTAVGPSELVTEVWFPRRPPATGTAFMEVTRRHGDFALVGVAASVTVGAGGIAGAAVALSGVADRPVRCPEVERALIGSPASTETLSAARRAAVDLPLAPASDVHASAEYRRAVVPVLVERALAQATSRVGNRSEQERPHG